MSKRTVLVIEDEAHISTVVRYNLSLEGLDVLTASDGAAGVRTAQQAKPDLILLDWMLPDINGLEVLTKLKHNAATARIPVLMMSAKGRDSDVDRAFEVGAEDYIVKPFNPNHLRKTVMDKLDEIASRPT